MLDFEEVNTAICEELTLIKLELLKDFDINYRPGYRVVLETNLQGARDFGLKEYKTCRREIEGMETQQALNYLREKEIYFEAEANKEKEKATDEYDAPIREYWSFKAAHTAVQVLMKQITQITSKLL